MKLLLTLFLYSLMTAGSLLGIIIFFALIPYLPFLALAIMLATVLFVGLIAPWLIKRLTQ